MPYRCCKHCDDDPGYHEDNPRDSHTTTCGTPGRPCDDGGDEYVPAKQEGAEQ